MNNSKYKICIVILNYNSFSDTKDCIVSLMNQTYKAFTILIIDNHSSDGSIENLQSNFPNLVFIKNNKNLGFTGGCNMGINYGIDSGYDYILLLNNDTVAHPKMLENIFSYIELHPDVSLLTGKIYYKDFPNKLWYAGGKLDYLRLKGIHSKLNRYQDDINEKNKFEVNFISGCMMVIKRDVIDKIGLLDDFFFANYEDVDYCLRVSFAGLSMSYLSNAIIWHKVSPNFKSSNKLIKFTPVSYYLKARNKIYLIKKYAKVYSILCLIVFNSPKLLKYILGFTFLLKIKELKYLLLGLHDGMFSKPIRFNI